jgi:hypothetical protein
MVGGASRMGGCVQGRRFNQQGVNFSGLPSRDLSGATSSGRLRPGYCSCVCPYDIRPTSANLVETACAKGFPPFLPENNIYSDCIRAGHRLCKQWREKKQTYLGKRSKNVMMQTGEAGDKK